MAHKDICDCCIFVALKYYIGGSRGGGGLRGLQRTPLSNFKKIKESNKTKQKIVDNPLEKEEERKSCMFV